MACSGAWLGRLVRPGSSLRVDIGRDAVRRMPSPSVRGQLLPAAGRGRNDDSRIRTTAPAALFASSLRCYEPSTGRIIGIRGLSAAWRNWATEYQVGRDR